MDTIIMLLSKFFAKFKSTKRIRNCDAFNVIKTKLQNIMDQFDSLAYTITVLHCKKTFHVSFKPADALFTAQFENDARAFCEGRMTKRDLTSIYGTEVIVAATIGGCVSYDKYWDHLTNVQAAIQRNILLP
jgi:DNA topoisomerase VI subunit A